MSRILSKSFTYANATATAKPGYLKRKFDRIRKEQADAQKAAAQSNVKPIKRAKP